MKNKNYEFDYEKVNKIVDEMFEDGEDCGLSEMVRGCCGDEYYENYGKEELDYVEEVMRELFKIKVMFNLDREVMIIIDGEVEE
jgi:hypothetical protein